MTTEISDYITAYNKLFENYSEFKYLETAVTNGNQIDDEIGRGINSG
jgi:hypothetical protein